MLADDGLRELHQASGGDWGGSSVNKQFIDFMTKILGENVMGAVKRGHPGDWLELEGNFEMKKCKFEAYCEEYVTLHLPWWFRQVFEEKIGMSLGQYLNKYSNSRLVVISNDKIRISGDLFKSFFETSIKNILFNVSGILDRLPSISSILVVGGFAECPLLTERLRQRFINHDVIVPENPCLAVLKGAVLFGFSPDTFQTRVCRYTYGIANLRNFIPGIDPIAKRRKGNNRYFCDDAFDKHVERGSIISIGQFQEEKEYRVIRRDQQMVFLELYASTELDPSFVTDKSCNSIGVLEIQLEDEENDGVFVKINVSGTELEVRATVKPSGRIVSTKCNFLG